MQNLAQLCILHCSSVFGSCVCVVYFFFPHYPWHLLRGDRKPQPEPSCFLALNTPNRPPEQTHPYGLELSAPRWLFAHLSGILGQKATRDPPCFTKIRMDANAERTKTDPCVHRAEATARTSAQKKNWRNVSIVLLADIWFYSPLRISILNNTKPKRFMFGLNITRIKEVSINKNNLYTLFTFDL